MAKQEKINNLPLSAGGLLPKMRASNSRNYILQVTIDTALVRDPFKDFRVQMAKTERVVNPLRDLCTERITWMR